MTVEELQAEEIEIETENDISNDGDDTEDPDNEMGVGGNSAKTPVSLLQVFKWTYQNLSRINILYS